MSRNNGKSPKVDLKVNLSPAPPRGRGGPSSRAVADDGHSPNRSSSSSSTVSPPSSCVSSEGEQKQSNSPEATSMVLAGCPQCLMYVMLSEDDPKCPKCKSTVLVDFHRGNNNKTRKG
ncbi:protein GL2-INTERACTING REPRESSOR 2 [Elaeis guineensis]|uniref:Uncharacterized protein LOC105033959 n=1 Tax=Elaeis guineensis var. tenera TaxID=51953 RepID=A0A8N4EYK5_ELAGV|nr:uncharacterized protein LOC105033959 [Elaeis guineensis]